jgi:ATP-dependent RNA helicase DeaD
LVATDVAARGIDVPDIAVVIQIELPMDADTYTHRCGRTGRAGKKGRSLILAPPVARRKIERVLKYAKVEAQFQPAPEAKKVMKTLVKRMRKGLRARLEDEKGHLEADLTYATQLLEGRDPATVVAGLLDLLKPQMPCAPKHLVNIDPNAKPERSPEHGTRKRHETKFSGKGSGSYIQFAVSWGSKSGASPSRILSHVCRRGDVKSNQVGAIRIGPESTIVDITSAMASVFESKVRAPDTRDPGIEIQLHKGGELPQESAMRRVPSGRPRSGGAGAPGGRYRSGRPDKKRAKKRFKAGAQ